jgi:hypothetical protein
VRGGIGFERIASRNRSRGRHPDAAVHIELVLSAAPDAPMFCVYLAFQ